MTTATVDRPCVHPFEKAGLGVAPFRITGCFESAYCGGPGCPIQPGTTCDLCGQGIRYVVGIEDANGKPAKVGCDCIRKIYSKGSPLLTEVEKLEKAVKRQAQDARDAERIEAAKARLAADPSLFADKPHPSSHFAAQGKTARDYVLFLLNGWGRTGRINACKIIENA